MAVQRDHARHGPIPTLAQLAQGTSWVWARCPERECLHDAAIPLQPVIALLGDVSSDRLRAALRCMSCGHRGALIQHPSWAMSDGFERLPLDCVPPALMRRMADDALRSIGAQKRA